MARKSDISGKKTIIASRRKHKHSEGWKFRAQRTSRTWKPSLKKATISVNGKKERVKLTVKEYKKLAEEGKIVR